ncbi:MAG: SMP-30/gluconolactonase/LRE family protein [Alphaproteobacteria bacterium]|nr:SMP-30/gluconolactonase/LRE family protein [Alphaproteobacteria bacterium]
MRVTCVVDARCWLGEGPVWSAAEGCLTWADVPAYRVHRWYPASGRHDVFTTPEMVISLALCRSGGLIAATTTGIELWNPDSGARRRIATPESALPGNRSNDGKCDRRGRFWLGTMGNNLNPDGTGRELPGKTGQLHRIDGDGTSTRMDGPFGICNTLAWSPDDRTMYFGDSLVGIYAYDFDLARGTISGRRRFAVTDDPALGVPDGSTIDAEGYLWNCRWGGASVLRWAPDGTLDRRIDLPCDQVTSAAFGGPDLSILYVTTARHGLDEAALARQPLAGGLFAIEAGVSGIAEVPFNS